MDPDQTAPKGAVCSGSTLFASMLNSSVMLGNYMQQTTSADDFFKCIFLGALRVKISSWCLVTDSVLWSYSAVLSAGLQCVIMVFSDHTHLLVWSKRLQKAANFEIHI